MNQKVSTGLGTAILLVMAFTAGYFVWMIESKPHDESRTLVTYKQDTKSMPSLDSVKEDNGDMSENRKIEESFCEKFAGESDFEIREIPGRKGWNIFVNSRDLYQFEYPLNELEVSGLYAKSSDKTIWSAGIGYPNKLGAFASLQIYCGSTEEAISSYYDKNEQVKIVSKKDIIVDGKKATRVLWKDIKYSDKAVGQQVVIQYNEDRVLIVSGPLGEQKKEKLFDDLMKSLVFLNGPKT